MSGTQRKFDVIIVGSGPAGIFAALELSGKAPGLRVALLDKGPDLPDRKCPSNRRGASCRQCRPCSVVSGWGGAGAFSDGKLTLTTEIGGWLDEYLGRELLAGFINYVDQVYVNFGAPEAVYGADGEIVRQLSKQAAAADLALIPSRIRHLGTDRCLEILERIRDHLEGRVEVMTSTAVARFVVQGGRATGVVLDDGRRLDGEYVICAPGREGATWFAGEAERIGLDMDSNPVDIGVRIELPAVVTDHLTDRLYESKLVYYTKSFDDRVRVFCMAPHGEVVVENNDGLITVNGHSYSAKQTELTNFALLVSKTFTEPFREPLAYGKNIAALANMLGGSVLVQRLGDLLAGRRSTPTRIQRGMVRPSLEEATPGDLSLVLPYRHLTDILEMMQALNKIAPGVYSRHTLMYGIEVKFYSARPKLTRTLETQVAGLFAAGDGAGITRGLVQASVSGVWIAREILRRNGAVPESPVE